MNFQPARKKPFKIKKKVTVDPSFDSDAQAFITAAGISDSAIQNAVNSLVLSLKSAGIWNDLIAFYPFVGGNATAHSYNLKNPATFQGTFVGSPTHSADGVAFNGTSQYMQTGIIPSTNLGLNSGHLMAHIKTASTTTGRRVMGAKAASDYFCELVPLGTSSNVGARINGLASTNVVSSTDQAGFFLAWRKVSTEAVHQKNTTQGTDPSISTGRASVEILIGCVNGNGTPQSHIANTVYGTSVGTADGFDSAVGLSFNQIMADFKTALGRA